MQFDQKHTPETRQTLQKSFSVQDNRGLRSYGIAGRTNLNIIPRGMRRFIKNKTFFQVYLASKEKLLDTFTPNLDRLIPLSPLAKQALTDFKTKGFAKLQHPKYLDLANFFSQKYLNKITPDNSPLHLTGQDLDVPEAFMIEKDNLPIRKTGNRIFQLSLKDPRIMNLALDQDIHSLLAHYTVNRVQLREQPLLEIYNYSGSDLGHDIGYYAAAFHVDPFRQINVMLLLDDIDETMTSTEYAVGSNQRNVFLTGFNVEYPRSNDLLHFFQYPVVKLTGKKGDVILMDTTGFHRVCPVQGTLRKWVVMVVNPGHVVPGFRETISPSRLPEGLSHYSKNFLKTCLEK